MDFKVFKTAIAKQFQRMQATGALFRVATLHTDDDDGESFKDKLYAKYQSSFPKGTNPVFRKRFEHDCGCCKQFIRAVGDVVAIDNGKVISIWDIHMADEPEYTVVAQAMAKLVYVQTVTDQFLHYESLAGTDKSFEQMLDRMHTWSHFFVSINSKFVAKKDEIATKLSEFRSTREVFARGLECIDMESIDTVLELISQGKSLYRGNEFRPLVEDFRKYIVQYDKLETSKSREIFSWECMASKLSTATAKIRSTSIGTLLEDLTKGVELDDAVKMYESKVAPANYKRPTALVTPSMVKKAKEELEALGLTSALQRRFATIDDINPNDILFVDRSLRKKLEFDVFDGLGVTSGRTSSRIEEVPYLVFVSEILPKAASLEVMVENNHLSNLVSLIAPEDPTAGSLFKWNNKFSWSYAGNMADSIKERVKAAGGSIEGDLCCRLAWEYRDDLDFHMYEPGGGHIYFSNRKRLSNNGGMLDLDANGLDGQRDDPAENIFYRDRSKMEDGTYTLSVNNYSRRSDGVGFVVQIEFDGQTFEINHEKALRDSETITVAKIRKTGSEFKIIESLPASRSVRETWGIKTNMFLPVNVVMLSPNYWQDKGVGNMHVFFMIDGCVNDGSARGFFNEFLREEFSKHRKVFETVGSKLKVPDAQHQLSGVGFSSTQKNTLVCRVKGSFTRTIKIVF